jgi:tellurite resistance protein
MKLKMQLQLRELFDKIVGEKSRFSPEQQQLAIDLSLAVMALVAAADEYIDDYEIIEVQELYAKHSRGMVDPATVRKAFDIVISDEASTWRLLSTAKNLSGELREDIFLAALRVARADSDVHHEESALLVRIGEALGLPPARINDLCGGEM